MTTPMTTPTTKAGRWLVDRSRWDDGMRGFFVRINATAGPDDMHRHVLAIEAEAAAAALAALRERVEGLPDVLATGNTVKRSAVLALFPEPKP